MAYKVRREKGMTECLCGNPVEFWFKSAKGRYKWYCKSCGIVFAMAKTVHQKHVARAKEERKLARATDEAEWYIWKQIKNSSCKVIRKR